jgi:hypothetical protein
MNKVIYCPAYSCIHLIPRDIYDRKYFKATNPCLEFTYADWTKERHEFSAGNGNGTSSH